MLINVEFFKKIKRFGNTKRLANRSLITFFLSVIVLSLSACGFHLRSYGKASSHINTLSMNCPSTSAWELCHHLKQTLLLNNIEINENAPLILSISPMIQESRVLSLQANASAAEQGLSSEITYTLLSAKEDVIKHKQSIHINNSYRHESSALLAKDRERDELQMQLSQQLAEEIVRQITVLNPDNWLDTESDQAQTTGN